MKSLLLCSLFFMTSTTLMAEEKDPHYVGSYEQNFTSDSLILKKERFFYGTNKRDLSYPYLSEKETGRDIGFEAENIHGRTSSSESFSGQKYSVLFGKKKALNRYRRIGLSSHTVTHKGVSKTTFAGELLVQRRYGEERKHFSELKISHDYIYKNMSLPAGVDSFLTATSFDLTSSHSLNPLWRLGSQLSYWDYSDNHSHYKGQLKLLYGLSPSWPWLWIGGQTEYLSHSQDRSGYWTPKTFSSYGLKFEGAFPLYRDFIGVAELAANKIKENSGAEGEGFTSFIGLQYKTRESWNLKLQYMTISSRQSGSPWTQNSFFVVLSN